MALRGTVTEHNRGQASAQVSLDEEDGGGTLSFVTTCFYGARGHTYPSVGERVRVFFTENGEDILAVIASAPS